ncbi:MAG: PPC domain-containing protein [Bacteroidales bacterium]|nr:PPC domain-containing protein [Bacteroidales bacterium]
MKKYFAMIALMLPMAVMAQEEKDNTLPIPQEEKALSMAAELSKYGYANKDALSLIQAARLSKQYGFVVEAKEKTTTGEGQTESAGEKKSGQVSINPSKLLADATEMAGDDGVLLALIDDVNSNVRGASYGAKYSNDCVRAHDTDVYTVTFRGGELAIVAVIGDGDTDLDLYIYDSNGNLVASDSDYTDDCVCTWTPRWTGSFKIKIRNRGSISNCYLLRTN